MPKLSSFIRQHSRQILSEWETFARTLPFGAALSVAELRDHAQAMLDVIASDLETPQTAVEQTEKSKGLRSDRRASTTAAAEHGLERAESGFTVIQMVAEFRALRASVVRLWTSHEQHFGTEQLNDLIRFNESIDQAIAESLARYTREIEETRERFLAILGHDLRNPLGAVATSASFLLETGELTTQQTTLIQGIERAGKRMEQLVADLLALALRGLGKAMPVMRSAADVGGILRSVVAEVRASHPRAIVDVRLDGDLSGEWDSARLAQALTNLLGNAVQHGDATLPITVTARATPNEAIIAVHNQGPRIAPEEARRLFKGRSPETNVGRGHLGLGLFIVDQIVEAHGGTIEVQSTTDAGTTFTIRLPKLPPPVDGMHRHNPGTAT